jgi:DNA-binding CsgD family transcriptional regulator
MVIGAFITTFLDFSQVSVENIIYYQSGLFIEFVFFTIAVNYTYVKDRLEKVNVLYKNSVLNLEKQQKEQENKALQYEIDAKNRGLASKAILLSEKENLIAELIKQLNGLKKGTNDKPAIQRLINNLNVNLLNNSWDEFEKHFSEVHPSFYKALSKKYPNLTASDRKLCAFMKLNLTTKEISTITGKSVNTIDVARSRLRKKIGLKSKDNLQIIISNIN